MSLTHFDANGAAHMVDVGQKAETQRTAVASGSIVMTPTCPHSLNNRSVVFAPLKTIEVRSTMPGKHEKLFVVVDGANLEPVDQGESVTIGKSQKVSRFISFQEQDFYQTLKEKLRSR